MRSIRLVVAFLFLIGGAAVLAATGATAGAAPGVVVRPSAHLVGGDTVHLVATGVTPSADVRIVQCNEFGGPDQDCYNSTPATADGAGRVSADVTLSDPVYQYTEVGDSPPVYCRAQDCRLFVVWTDASGNQQYLQSNVLGFQGAPAVIIAKPDAHLAATQRVAVRGSAHGAAGHQARVFEETCYDIIQGHDCTQQYPAVTVTLDSGGFYWTPYTVHRYLPDGRDCSNADEMGTEYCQLSVEVLSHGAPDYSFGDPTWGDPHGPLFFKS